MNPPTDAVRCSLALEEMCRQDYAGRDKYKQPMSFSAGLVKGAQYPGDRLYLKLEKKGRPDEDVLIYVTPDEAAAIAWVLMGTLESFLRPRREQFAKEGE